MYDALSAELDKISADIDSGELLYTSTGSKSRAGDMITNRGIKAYKYYKDKDTPSQIWKPIDEYIAKSKVFRSIAKRWQDLVKQTYEAIKDYSPEQLKDLLDKIVKSKAFESVGIKGELDVLTPEEKFWAAQVIKTVQGNAPDRPKTKLTKVEHSKEYRDAYNTIIRSCKSRSQCSDEELNDIIETVRKLIEPSKAKEKVTVED